MESAYKEKIENIVKEGNQFNQLRQITGWVTEKKGVVVRKSQFSPDWINEIFVLRGKIYSVLPHTILPLRTLFLKKPVRIGNTIFYLEVKGYGFNGRELYFQEHVSGDIFYGMYLDSALREFDRMSLALSLGLPVPLPVAVVEIPKDEYIKKGIAGFKGRLIAELTLGSRIKLGEIEEIIGPINEFNPERIAQKLINYIKRAYKEDLAAGVDFVVSKLSNPPKWGYGINDGADALLSGKKVGYLIRASRCPIRVGDPSDKNIDKPEFREIARLMGYTFKTLLENGILHHCPSTGNWTIAGELTDFTDTFELAKEEKELRAHIKKLKQEGRISKGNLRNFLSYLIGPKHGGLLSPYFLEGMFGQPISLEEATRRLLKLF